MSELEYGLLGEKLGHSFSPAIHRKLAGYGYRLVEKKPEELADFLTHGTFQGLNVTIPYKKAVIPFCRTLTDQARRIGSVNTIVRQKDGTLLRPQHRLRRFCLYAPLRRGRDSGAKRP